MNYCGQHYTDGDTDYISIIEGVYYSGSVAKARVIGALNLTENKMIKYAKQPYDVLDLSDGIITLRKYRVDLITHDVYYDDKYRLLHTILVNLDQNIESIPQIIESINRISSDKRITSNKNCMGEYVSL